MISEVLEAHETVVTRERQKSPRDQGMEGYRMHLMGLHAIPGTILVLGAAFFCSPATGKVVFVDRAATGANDGRSWAGAYTCLQNALANAALGGGPVEIRIAQGVYQPNDGVAAPPGFNGRAIAFTLSNGVTLKGGYAGAGRPDPNVRDIASFQTILSGDLQGNDAEGTRSGNLVSEGTRQENSYHVITAVNLVSDTVMDGLIVAGGNANGPKETSSGGGLYCYSSRVQIVHCEFRNNAAVHGGGILNGNWGNLAIQDTNFVSNGASAAGGAIENGGQYGSTLTLEDCTFAANSSTGSGGAILTAFGNPVMTRCTFVGNVSARGGGIYNFAYGNPTLSDCTFTANSATDFGGGVYNNSGTGQVFLRCLFQDNRAGWYGGGLYNSYGCHPLVQNSIFTNNSTNHWGGAIHFSRCTGEIRNCTIVGNSAPRGGAVACGFEGEAVPSNVKITNSILWSNGEEFYNYDGSQITTTYDCIEGLAAARTGLPDGNLGADPCFAEPGHWTTAGGADPNRAGAVWVGPDYHLKSELGRWDPATQAWVLDPVTSPCINAGSPISDVGDEPMPTGQRIDMGAYGGTSEASKSLHIVHNIPPDAHDPSPWNRFVDVPVDTILSWTPGRDVVSHQIYFGPNLSTVATAGTGSAEYRGSQPAGQETYYPSLLNPGTIYYWRIDEVDSQGRLIVGRIWSFTTLANRSPQK